VRIFFVNGQRQVVPALLKERPPQMPPVAVFHDQKYSAFGHDCQTLDNEKRLQVICRPFRRSADEP
jgi:hypothetical protein